jgi:hypothetical protein
LIVVSKQQSGKFCNAMPNIKNKVCNAMPNIKKVWKESIFEEIEFVERHTRF